MFGTKCVGISTQKGKEIQADALPLLGYFSVRDVRKKCVWAVKMCINVRCGDVDWLVQYVANLSKHHGQYTSFVTHSLHASLACFVYEEIYLVFFQQSFAYRSEVYIPFLLVLHKHIPNYASLHISGGNTGKNTDW